MTDEIADTETLATDDSAAPEASAPEAEAPEAEAPAPQAPVSYPKVTQFNDDDADIVHYAPTGHVLPEESDRV